MRRMRSSRRSLWVLLMMMSETETVACEVDELMKESGFQCPGVSWICHVRLQGHTLSQSQLQSFSTLHPSNYPTLSHLSHHAEWPKYCTVLTMKFSHSEECLPLTWTRFLMCGTSPTLSKSFPSNIDTRSPSLQHLPDAKPMVVSQFSTTSRPESIWVASSVSTASA